MNTTTNPLVSIVMPAYNAEKFVVLAIESILKQTYQNFELLIADDCSKDSTRKLIDSFNDARIKTFHNTENIGYLKTCNILFSKCVGPLMTFQDADDFSDPNRLEIQVKVMNEHPEYGFCGTWYKRISFTGEQIGLIKKPCSYEEIMHTLKTGNAFCGAAVIIRKEVYDVVGGYREFYNRMGNEDYDWTYLIAEKYKGINIDQYLYGYRYNPASVSQEISLKRFLSSEHVIYFAHQRATKGKDDLQIGDMAIVEAYVKSAEAPFLNDKTLIYRKYANAHLHGNNFKKSYYFIFKAIFLNIIKPVNYVVLLAIIKKNIWIKLGILKVPAK